MTLDEEKVLKKLKNKHTKESIILLDYISKLQKDIEIKDKVIEKAFKYIDEHTYRDMEECEFGETNNLTCIKDCDTCIKQYFYKQVEKVEEENENNSL